MSISFTDKCMYSLPVFGFILACHEESVVTKSIKKITGLAYGYGGHDQIHLHGLSPAVLAEVHKCLIEKNEVKKYKLVGLFSTFAITLVALSSLQMAIPFILICAIVGGLIGHNNAMLGRNRATIRELDPASAGAYPIGPGSVAVVH